MNHQYKDSAMESTGKRLRGVYSQILNKAHPAIRDAHETHSQKLNIMQPTNESNDEQMCDDDDMKNSDEDHLPPTAKSKRRSKNNQRKMECRHKYVQQRSFGTHTFSYNTSEHEKQIEGLEERLYSVQLKNKELQYAIEIYDQDKMKLKGKIERIIIQYQQVKLKNKELQYAIERYDQDKMKQMEKTERKILQYRQEVKDLQEKISYKDAQYTQKLKQLQEKNNNLQIAFQQAHSQIGDLHSFIENLKYTHEKEKQQLMSREEGFHSWRGQSKMQDAERSWLGPQGSFVTTPIKESSIAQNDTVKLKNKTENTRHWISQSLAENGKLGHGKFQNRQEPKQYMTNWKPKERYFVTTPVKERSIAQSDTVKLKDKTENAREWISQSFPENGKLGHVKFQNRQEPKQYMTNWKAKEITLCIACPNSKYLKVVTDNVESLIQKRLQMTEINVCSRQINRSGLQSKDFFDGAGLIMLVATASQRLLIISEKEESQLGSAYKAAVRTGADIFLVLVAHGGSENMREDAAYVDSLRKMFCSQPAIGNLAEENKFISTGFAHNIENFSFNRSQTQAIVSWIDTFMRSRL